uniref:Glycosyltransferase 2-like domain-containing protein n=1 Tax=viral metagenome TaxID=1070528 RepID=A0A6C0BJX4_9ZZZZ
MAIPEVKPFLCLNMIVKNESRIIKRLIDTALPIIDSYCICDTGSTDNTIEMIRNYMTEKKIPGEVFELPFRDFGYNRTESLKRAEKWGRYALLLDADMKLEILPDFKKSDIILDMYQIKQKNAALDYYNTRIVRTDKGITCVGVTHEYYNAPPGTSSGQLNTLEIDDVGDGGAKSDKFERDVRLLRKGLLEDPKNVRYRFYLANSYRDLATMIEGRDRELARKYLKRAIKWYHRRIEMGGWDEELFHSCYEIGNIYRKMEKYDRAVYWWSEAYLHRKTRAESLYEIIKYYREKDAVHAELAAHYYDIAKKIPYPKNDVLFVRKAVYDYLLDYECSILAYYQGWPVDHYRYLNMIGKHDNYGNVLSNYQFYVKRLSSLRPVKQLFNDPMTLPGKPDQFRPSTSCLIPYQDGYLMNQRYVNYFIEPNGAYTVKEPITTFNRRFRLDKKLQPIDHFDFDVLPSVVNRYAGIEDVKIFPYQNQIYFFGTEEDLKSKTLGVAGGIYPTTDESHALTSEIYPSPTNSGCEKNWCYFEGQGKLRVMYKWAPMVMGQIIEQVTPSIGHQLNLDVTDHNVPAFFQHLRGSSNGFTYKDEIWFVTHMVEYSAPRKYYHCLVILDHNTLKYKRHSILFKFEDSPIEYCLGLIVEDERLIFGYSKMDRETIVCAYARPEVDRLIFPSITE